MKELGIVKAVEALEHTTALDPSIGIVHDVVERVIQPRGLRDLLHGVWIGHPIHPIAVLVPAGAWISAAVLDLLPGEHRAARTLVGLGLLSVTPVAASGITDWSALRVEQQRVGIVHWAANLAAIGFYSASYVQRVRGKQHSGKMLGFVGLTIVSGAGYLGSHLAHRQAAGANHADYVMQQVSMGWHTLGLISEFQEDRSILREIEGVPLLVHRNGVDFSILADTCTHCGASLYKGEQSDATTVTCAADASVFELATGRVLHGPATAAQPRFDVVVNGGMVDIRRPGG